MEKIASDASVSPELGVEIASRGFAAMLGGPATDLTPQKVQDYTVEFHKRAAARMERHMKIRELVMEHVG